MNYYFLQTEEEPGLSTGLLHHNTLLFFFFFFKYSFQVNTWTRNESKAQKYPAGTGHVLLRQLTAATMCLMSWEELSPLGARLLAPSCHQKPLKPGQVFNWHHWVLSCWRRQAATKWRDKQCKGPFVFGEAGVAQPRMRACLVLGALSCFAALVYVWASCGS